RDWSSDVCSSDLDSHRASRLHHVINELALRSRANFNLSMDILVRFLGALEVFPRSTGIRDLVPLDVLVADGAILRHLRVPHRPRFGRNVQPSKGRSGF